MAPISPLNHSSSQVLHVEGLHAPLCSELQLGPLQFQGCIGIGVGALDDCLRLGQLAVLSLILEYSWVWLLLRSKPEEAADRLQERFIMSLGRMLRLVLVQ